MHSLTCSVVENSDDLATDQLERLRPASFMMLTTSPEIATRAPLSNCSK